MAYVLMALPPRTEKPTLEEVREDYGLDADDLDARFGVALIDPRDGTYAVRVDEGAMEKVKPGSRPGDSPPLRGPYSDPRIEPTGTPKPVSKTH